MYGQNIKCLWFKKIRFYKYIFKLFQSCKTPENNPFTKTKSRSFIRSGI